jgi:protoporphyrinogen oxidase
VLARRGIRVTVLESDAQVGGISRTVEHDGFRFDIGGHRFYTKSAAVNALWDEMLPDGFITRERFSRIFYGGKFYSYPLKPFEALMKLGPAEAVACTLSYVMAQIRPHAQPRTFEEWVVNRFGRRLFEIFFKTYTEKVWGIGCDKISSDWAAQRIGTLSLLSALLHALPVPWGRETAKTVIQTFRYPRWGPGMLWEACARTVTANGGVVRLRSHVDSCVRDGDDWVVGYVQDDGTRGEVRARHLVSSAPLTHVVKMLGPAASEHVHDAASGLKYRDFITVCLMFDCPMEFRDQWIYVHDPGVRVGRVQNFGAWSSALLPRPDTGCLGLEYFCHEGDGLWNMSDADLIDLARRELQQTGILVGAQPTTGYVLRQPKAYPVYDATYGERVDCIRQELETRYPTLYFVGRNGMHKYNNQDHAMMTGLLTAENIALGNRVFDVWRVNADADYIESGTVEVTKGTALRATPRPVTVDVTDF